MANEEVGRPRGHRGARKVAVHGLFARLLAVMCGVAAVSTGLALVLQERSLSGDLQRAAERRLENAAGSAERLLAGHLDSMMERYGAVSGTPQFRATLEIDDGPTLAHYAEALLRQQHAARIAFVRTTGDLAAGAGPSELDEAALAVEGAGAIAVSGAAYAVVSTPLASVGRLVAVEPIGGDILAAWSELCGARVSFVPRGEAAPPGEIGRRVRELGALDLQVASSLDAERQAMRRARLNSVMAAGFGLAVAFGVSLLMTRGLASPIQELQRAARRIGGGDLTSRVSVDRSDEIGDVARAFGDMVAELRATIRQVAGAADRVEHTAESIGVRTERFFEVSRDQQSGHEEAAATLERIGIHVQEIIQAASESAQSLDLAVDGSTESFRELGESGSVLRENAACLGQQSGEMTSSLEEVAIIAARVAHDAEALLPAVEAAATSVGSMARAAESVNANAEETSRLSLGVVETAENGRRVVRDAVRGMQTTLQTIEDSERVIQSLSERATEIGAILEVIDAVTDDTRLLALNAAIIASKTGESGRAFKVVADEMKALSQRVQASTQEIGAVVRAVQGESASAVASIGRGSARAREGAALIEQAETTLIEITRAARESGDRMAESTLATAQQMSLASGVAEQMESVREGVARIGGATREQAGANETVQRSSDVLSSAAKAVESAVDVQTRGTSRIGVIVETVQQAVAAISRGLEQQDSASSQLAGVLQRSMGYTQSHQEAASEITSAVSDLQREAEVLREVVGRFRT